MRPVPNAWCDSLGEVEIWRAAFGMVASLGDGLVWLALALWGRT